MEVYYLDPTTARTISMVKGSINHDRKTDKHKYADSIAKHQRVLKDLMKEVLATKVAA